MKNLLYVTFGLFLLLGACKNTTDNTVEPTAAVMTGDVLLMGGGAGDPRPDSLHMPDSSRCGSTVRITIDSLPTKAKTYISTNYAGYSVVKLFKQTKRDTVRFIVVVSKDTVTKVLVFDKTGTFQSVHTAVNGHRGGTGDPRHPVGGFKEEDVPVASLLPVIKTYISTNYAGYTTTKAEKETAFGVSIYEVEIQKGTTKKRLYFDINGKFLRVG